MLALNIAWKKVDYLQFNLIVEKVQDIYEELNEHPLNPAQQVHFLLAALQAGYDQATQFLLHSYT